MLAALRWRGAARVVTPPAHAAPAPAAAVWAHDLRQAEEHANVGDVLALLAELGVAERGRGVAVAIDGEVRPGSALSSSSSPTAAGWRCWVRSKGAEAHSSTLAGGDALRIADRVLRSRILGSGGFTSLELLGEAIVASGGSS